MPPAAKAWWDMLETQFKQVAAATAATLSPKTDSKSPDKGKQTVKQAAGASGAKAARKTSARKSVGTTAVSQKTSRHGSDDN